MLFDIEGVKTKRLQCVLNVARFNGSPVAFLQDLRKVFDLQHLAAANRDQSRANLVPDIANHLTNMLRVSVVKRSLCTHPQRVDVYICTLLGVARAVALRFLCAGADEDGFVLTELREDVRRAMEHGHCTALFHQLARALEQFKFLGRRRSFCVGSVFCFLRGGEVCR